MVGFAVAGIEDVFGTVPLIELPVVSIAIVTKPVVLFETVTNVVVAGVADTVVAGVGDWREIGDTEVMSTFVAPVVVENGRGSIEVG